MSERGPRRLPPLPSERTLVIALVLLGAGELALGVFQAVAPHAFYRALGGFGPRNDHYIRDVATYSLAIGAALLGAARRPSWRVPVLALTTLQFALHAVNHLVDIDASRYAGQGPGDFAALAVTAIALVGLLAASARPAAAPLAAQPSAPGQSPPSGGPGAGRPAR